MALRVTRQYVEAAGSVESYLRVSGQYVDVLSLRGAAYTQKLGTVNSILGRTLILGLGAGSPTGTEYSRAAVSSLTVTQAASLAQLVIKDAGSQVVVSSTATSNLFSLGAESALAVNQDENVVGPIYRSLTSTLLATQAASPGLFLLDSSSALTFGQAALSGLFDKEATSPLTLNQTALSGLSTPLVISALSLAQTAHQGLVGRMASSVLALVQTVGYVGPVNRPASSALALAQSSSTPIPYRRAATSQAAFGHGVSYVGPRYATAGSSLVFDHNGYLGRTYDVGATSALQVAATAVRSGTIRIEVVSTLSAQSLADTGIKARTILSQLGLADLATTEQVRRATSLIVLVDQADEGFIPLFAASALSLDHIARPNPIERDATTAIDLADQARSSIRLLAVASAVELVDSHRVVRPYRVSASSPLTTTELVFDLGTLSFVEVESGLGQSAAYVVNRVHSPQQFLQLTHEVLGVLLRADAIAADGSNSLALADDGRLSRTAEAGSLLDLVQELLGGAGLPIGNELELDDLAALTIERMVAALSDLALGQAFGFVALNDATDCIYSPFVGFTSDPSEPSPPPTALICPLPDQPRFSLIYPPSGLVTDSLVLGAPNFGNIDRLSFNRINRETRGGTLTIYADPIWPKVQSLVLSFSGLKRGEAQALLSFMQGHLGIAVGLMDWEGRYWVGVIVVPNDPIVEDAPNSYSASFEFEGQPSVWTERQIPEPVLCGGFTPGSPRQRASRRETPPCCTQAPVTSPPAGSQTYQAETDVDVLLGQPLYLTLVGHAALAQANSQDTAMVAGLSAVDAASGQIVQFATEGRVSRDDWTPITGLATLAVGRRYFLDPASPGRLTSTAPSSIGQFVVRVGRAVSATELDIEIEDPIGL